MRVKDCDSCPHKRRRTWTDYYTPRNYHPIGMTHAYAYCTLHKKRVLDVKKCAGVSRGQMDNSSAMERSST